MTVEPPTDKIRQIWRSQKTERATMPIDEIRTKADRFHRRILHRNLREYIGAAVVVLAFAWFAWKAPGVVTRTGSALMIAGTLFVAWQLHRRGAARRAPQSCSGMDLVEFQIEELTRQREALRSVWRWYLAPFIPGFVTLLAGFYFQDPATGSAIELHHQFLILYSTIMALLFVIIWLANAIMASRLQRHIDALEKARVE